MSDRKRTESWLPGSRRPQLFQAAELALRVIRRAEKQHAPGFAHTATGRIRTGLRVLDELRGLWWGLTVIHGGEHHTGSDHITLAARVAFETARDDSPVLWLSLDGNEETPVFRLLTGIARVSARDVFVTNTLGSAQWEALEVARAELASLPLRMGDAHGLTMAELRDSCVETARADRLALLVMHGIERFDASILSWLERLSQDMDVPVVAVVTTPDGNRDEAVKFTTLLPTVLIRTSPVLHVRRAPAARGAPSVGVTPLFVDLLRVAEPAVKTVELRLDVACRWIEDRGADGDEATRSG